MLSQPAVAQSPALFERVPPSTSSQPTSSTRRRLSGLINLLSYAPKSLLSSRKSDSPRHLNRHSIHGAIFRSPSARDPLPRPRSTTRLPHISPEEAFAASVVDALNFTSNTEILAEPFTINLGIPTNPSTWTGRNNRPDSSLNNHRLSTRFSEAAADALLRERSAFTEPVPEVQPQPSAVDADMTRSRSATLGTANEMSSTESLPSIRLSAFYDSRSTRPSLSFTPVARTLPTGRETIKVGRYSERENNVPVPINTPSAAPVGFKSKVVSRRHCEFWFEKGKWFVKDVKSSSGTFLNHIRLSAPGTESKPYPINDGDIVQLGIDFKGGEEMIYRCVKMRVELNRGWQAKPNTFNMATHKRLRDLTSTAASASQSAGAHAQDCSICLNAIAPCQSLFVAPCSHTWHYKCIREMLQGPSWPIFMCPNCRATADLDAEVDEPSEEWQQLPEDVIGDRVENESTHESNTFITTGTLLNGSSHVIYGDQEDPGDLTVQLGLASGSQSQAGPSRHTTSDPVNIPNGPQRKSPSPASNALLNSHEGPITPRNDAGPWVFDGNPARASQESIRRNGMASLNAAAQAGSNTV